MEPAWNPGTIDQVIGRAARYKSHFNLPIDQQLVIVYRILLIKPNESNERKENEPFDE